MNTFILMLLSALMALLIFIVLDNVTWKKLKDKKTSEIKNVTILDILCEKFRNIV